MGQDRAAYCFIVLHVAHMFLKQVEDKSLVKTEEVKDGHDLFLDLSERRRVDRDTVLTSQWGSYVTETVSGPYPPWN